MHFLCNLLKISILNFLLLLPIFSRFWPKVGILRVLPHVRICVTRIIRNAHARVYNTPKASPEGKAFDYLRCW